MNYLLTLTTRPPRIRTYSKHYPPQHYAGVFATEDEAKAEAASWMGRHAGYRISPTDLPLAPFELVETKVLA